MNHEQAKQVWKKAAEMVKDRVVSPTVFRAVELAHGLAIDDDVFVLGFSPTDMPMASHIKSSQNFAIVEQCIGNLMGRRMRVLIVEGVTAADYERYKQNLERASANQATISKRREQERAVEVGWDLVAEKISRFYAQTPLRTFPQTRAKILSYGLEVINDAMNKLQYSDDTDEVHKRALARVFDKFSTLVEVPSALLAYELNRLRKEGQLK